MAVNHHRYITPRHLSAPDPLVTLLQFALHHTVIRNHVAEQAFSVL